VSRATDHPKIPRQEQVLSAGAACYSLLLAAYASGYAGCWLTEWIAYDPAARSALGVRQDEEVAGMIYLGTARENALERPRIDPARLITRA
jgi:nitroreductase